jgi:predicted nuclease of predicted toxin-antitoxin system
VRFLIDAQLPPVLARRLATSGHDATHVFDIGLLAATDRDIWNQATLMNATIVTKDEDFVTMRALNSQGPSVVWIRIGNTRNRELIERFFVIFSTVLAGLERGQTVIEISGS